MPSQKFRLRVGSCQPFRVIIQYDVGTLTLLKEIRDIFLLFVCLNNRGVVFSFRRCGGLTSLDVRSRSIVRDDMCVSHMFVTMAHWFGIVNGNKSPLMLCSRRRPHSPCVRFTIPRYIATIFSLVPFHYELIGSLKLPRPVAPWKVIVCRLTPRLWRQ
jgi:hypothetical protein